VRDVPNERLVRWYVTVGLVDPPLSRRGRVARYGRRHLLQLVAVKRRQAEGRSLAEIQAELAGATDEALAAVARVPDAEPAPDVRPAAPARFWARQLGQRDLATAEPAQERDPAGARQRGERDPAGARQRGERDPAGARQRGERDPAGAEWAARPMAAAADGGPADRGAVTPAAGILHGVRLAPGVTLLLQGAGREPGPDDVTEIISAARPLLEELASRGLRADHLE
jgi:DNA-binding transcriptional MerR regulator